MGIRAHLLLQLTGVLLAAFAPSSVAAAELRLRPGSELTFFVLDQRVPSPLLIPKVTTFWGQPPELSIGPAAHRFIALGSRPFSDPASRARSYVRLFSGHFHFQRFRLSGISAGTPIALGAFEIGLKNHFLGDRLMINADVFGYRSARFRLPTLFSSLRPISRTAGADLELEYKLTSLDGAGLNVTYSNVSKPAASSILRLWLANRQAANITALQIIPSYEHILPLPNGHSLAFDASAIYRSSARVTNPIGSLESSVRKIDSTQFDASLAYRFNSRISMAAFVRNLTDVRPDRSMTLAARNNLNPATVSAVLSEPRTYGVVLGGRF